ncbi:MAG: ketopantoate reductase family protein [Burkholderiaceae bacterium]|jgi:2-dehydropantoate 2-reductase|nr:ketopantoate reductase family protein [Burkholderiaceae bacterium]
MKDPKASPVFRKVAVMGAGAVGSFYGAMLARAGHAVTLIGRPAHVQAIQRDGLQLEMGGQRHAVRLDASSDPAALAGADLVLCCVKSGDTEAAALQMAPHLGPAALLMSLQNGVDNAATLARHVPCRVVPAVVYVAVALGGPGVVRHFGRGDLAIGAMPGGTQSSVPEWPTLQAVVDFFAGAQVPVRIVPDVAVELWAKLLVNCAYNAISALAQMPYARLAARADIRALQDDIVHEVIAVAAASGVTLPLQASLDAVAKIAVAMPQQLSSTAQDMARRKPSEIDHLNGFIARRGAELGVPTPVNRTLQALVKLVESGYDTP